LGARLLGDKVWQTQWEISVCCITFIWWFINRHERYYFAIMLDNMHADFRSQNFETQSAVVYATLTHGCSMISNILYTVELVQNNIV
jgi:hypothetical protein